MTSSNDFQLTIKEHARIGTSLEMKLHESSFSKTQFYGMLSAPEQKNRVSESTIRKALQGKKVNLKSLKVIAINLGFSSLNELFREANLTYKIERDPVISHLQQSILKDNRVSSMPTLFSSDDAPPIGQAYIELSLSNQNIGRPNPKKTENRLTPREKLDRDVADYYTPRLGLRDALDIKEARKTLILGAPGSGKSSLQRRIALDISGQTFQQDEDPHWRHYDLPIFFSFREYWNAQKTSKANITLEEFGLRILIKQGYGDTLEDDSNIRRCLKLHSKRIIYLMDGLDEIANIRDAVDLIYPQLINSNYNWIVTCRPAGLLGKIGQTKRYKIQGLDVTGIEALIKSWANHSNNSRLSKQLATEIMTSDALSRMAQSPFLLTAMLFVKQYNLNQALPATQISLYERLVETIFQVAKIDVADVQNVFSPQAQRDLADFSFSLFTRQTEPQDIFSEEDWSAFCKREERDTDLKTQLVKGRLLEAASEINEYRFMHRSLHEHFVGRAMLNTNVDVWPRRLHPAWRKSFIAYAGLLHKTGELSAFKDLCEKLYKEQDYAGFQLILLANIFSACGINDSRKWVGDDIRDLMYDFCTETFSAHHDLMISALADMDPAWIEKKVLTEFDDPDYFDDFGGDEYYPWEDYAVYGGELDCPYFILSKTRTAFAKTKLEEIFWATDAQHAALASAGFARLSSLSDKKRVVEKGLKLDVDDPFFSRIYSFCQKANSPLSIPIYTKVLASSWAERPRILDDVSLGLRMSGGREGYKALSEFAVSMLKKCDGLTGDNHEIFSDILRSLSQLGGHKAAKELRKIELSSLIYVNNIDKIQELCEQYGIESGIYKTQNLINHLGCQKRQRQTIRALAGAALNGFAIDETILEFIKTLPAITLEKNLESLIHIESARLEIGHDISFAETIKQICLRRLKSGPIVESDPFYSYHLYSALEAFEKTDFRAVSQLITLILDECAHLEMPMRGALNLYGKINKGSQNTSALDRIKELLKTKSDYHENAYLAIARIWPPSLYPYLENQHAQTAIQLIAAEDEWLLFNSFWSNEFGDIFHSS